MRLVVRQLARKQSCGNSSVGRARPCQGRGREFESRFPLQYSMAPTMDITLKAMPCQHGALAKRLCSGLQIRLVRFDSGTCLHLLPVIHITDVVHPPWRPRMMLHWMSVRREQPSRCHVLCRCRSISANASPLDPDLSSPPCSASAAISFISKPHCHRLAVGTP